MISIVIRRRRVRFGPSMLVLAVLGGAAKEAVAAENLNGPTSYVDLPGYRPEEVAAKVVVARPIGVSVDKLDFLLFNPDAPSKGPVESYVVLQDPTTKAWRIDAVLKAKASKTVGRLSLENDAVHFQWEPGVSRADGGGLRNCVLGVIGAQDHVVGLRIPLRQAALVIDMSKELNRIALLDDLPEDGLTVSVSSVIGAEVPGNLSATEAKLKQPLFIGIKPADVAVPGARLRVILWKTSLKPEVLIRPELIPVINPAAAINTASDDADPTKPNQVNLPYTIKHLATAKSVIGRQLIGANNQISADRNLISQKQSLLARLEIDLGGTVIESGTIEQQKALLRTDITRLQAEVDQLQRVAIPELQRQLESFIPLESLGNSLHKKAAVNLRVFYLADGKPVDVLVASGDPTK